MTTHLTYTTLNASVAADGVSISLRCVSASASCVITDGIGVCDLTTGITNQNGVAMQVVATVWWGVNNGISTFKGNAALTKIVLPEGFVTMGTDSFNSCANLQEAILPNSLEAIGNSAFANCAKLHNVVVSKNLKTYNGNSFINCTSLTNDVASLLPGSVTTIGTSAFENSGITGALVITNKSITGINNNVFKNTKLKSVDLSQSAIKSLGGDSFHTITTLENVFLPDSLETIGGSATFANCAKLGQVVMSANLKTYGGNSFINCTSLTNSAASLLPGSVTSIGASAFESTAITGALVITNKSITSINNNVFKNTKLTSVDLSQSAILSFGTDSFCAITTLGEVRLPETLQTIGQSAFNSCTSLTNVTPLLPGTVTTMSGKEIFLNAPIVGNIVLSNPNLKALGSSLFKGTKLTSIDMSTSGIESFGTDQFVGIATLGEVRLPETLHTIGQSSFNACTSLTNVVPFLPLSVTNILRDAFNGCTGLTGILMLGGEKQVGVGNTVFYNTKVSEVYFGEGITSLAGTQIFSGATTLTNIWFKGNRPTFSANLFPGYANDLMARFFIPKGDASWDALTNIYEFALLNNTEEENYIAKYGNKNIPLGKFKPPVASNGKFQYLCTWRLPIAGDLITVILIK